VSEALIESVIDEVLRAEGGSKFTNNPADRGGPTKFGITQAKWSELLGVTATIDDIRNITEKEARDFYRNHYILAFNFHELRKPLIPLVVDCAVNHGRVRAAMWLQRAVGVKEDGVVGPKTIAAVDSAPWVQTYARICARRVRFYGAIVGRDHSQAVFISGWNNRAAKWVEALADVELDG
jgi:lysozyme family protein